MTGGSESLRISFLEAVYGFRVSFLSLCIFLRYARNLMSWQFRGQFVLLTKRIVLKTSGKSVIVTFIVNYICKIKRNMN